MVGKSEYWFSASQAKPSGEMFLLPGFDEYILGYTDRGAILTPEQAKKIVPGNNGMFMAAIVAGDGTVLGTWRRAITKGSVALTPQPFGPWGRNEMDSFASAGEQYARFLGLTLRLADS
jgi:hypothetical protein